VTLSKARGPEGSHSPGASRGCLRTSDSGAASSPALILPASPDDVPRHTDIEPPYRTKVLQREGVTASAVSAKVPTGPEFRPRVPAGSVTPEEGRCPADTEARRDPDVSGERHDWSSRRQR
jgi:hypothetical protein